MALVIGLAIPAIQGLAGVGGRRSAVISLLNTFEQARVLSLQSGSRVYVAFAGSDFPNPDYQLNRYIVLKERDPEVDGEGDPVFAVTEWRPLPTGIAFRNEPNSVVNPDAATVTARVSTGTGQAEVTLPAVVFNNMGMIESPGSTHLRLFIYEGFHRDGQDVSTSPDPFFDQIVFARFTGRAHWEVQGE